MPPLPIGTLNPLRSIPKEDKVANTTISGLSVGSNIITQSKIGTKKHRKNIPKPIIGGSTTARKRKKNVNSKGKGKTKNQKRINGRFVKS
jgi:hypothetical protein